MNHRYLPGRRIRALFAALSCVAAVCASAAGPRFIYILGYNTAWDMPVHENADKYETSKMYETSDGSNVYEGVFDMPSSWFRFITELSDSSMGTLAYKSNVISPKYDGYPLEPYGNSGAFVARNAGFDALLPNGVEAGSWLLPSVGTYKFIVDMNRELLVVAPAGQYLSLLDTDAAPTYLTLGDCNYNKVQYAGAGSMNLRFYDFVSGKWINPNTGKDKVTKTGAWQNFTSTTLSDTMGLPFSFDNWTGGTVATEVKQSKNVRIMVTPDNGPHTPEDAVYAVNRGEVMQPGTNASDAVMSTFLKLLPVGDGTYSATMKLTGNNKLLAVNFVTDLAADPADNMVLSPAVSGEMWAVDDGLAYASARKVRASEASYFTIPYRMATELPAGTEVKFTVNPGANPWVTFEFPSMKNERTDIWLVGTPNGWDNRDDSCPLHPTDKGGYYGHFKVDPEGLSFRFATRLGSWAAENFIGSDYQDFYEEQMFFDEEGVYRGPCVVGGLGNWAPQNLNSTDLYCYVEPDSRSVVFSDGPIPEAGNTLPTGSLGRKEGVFAFNDDPTNTEFRFTPRYEQFSRYDDVYRNTVSVPYGAMYLFTRIPAAHPSDPSWGDSYYLSPVEGAVYVLDDLGVAEGSFVKVDENAGAKVRPFTVVDKDGNIVDETSLNVEIDFASNKIYFEDMGKCPSYLVGAISGGEWPTYATRGNFRKCAIPRKGGIVDIPAGKMDFRFVRSIAVAGGQYLGEEAKVTFENGFAYINTDISTGGDQYGWSNKHVVCPEWEGGKVFVSDSRMLKMDGVDHVTAVVNSDSDDLPRYTLVRRDGASLVFSGKVKFHKLENPLLRQWLEFCLYSGGDEYEKQIYFASMAQDAGIGWHIYEDARNLLPQGNVYDAPMAFGGGNFYLPALKFTEGTDEVEMDVTVDLDAMTLHATVAEENVATVYEVVENDNAGIDGIYASPSPVQDDVVTFDAQVENTECSFNLTSPEGAVIQPAGGADVDVTFDQTGSYTGRFAKTPAGTRSAARRAAARSAKWNISLPENGIGQIFMAVDEAAGTVRIFAPDYNEGYFILPLADWNYLVYPGVENLDEMKKSMLRETSGGIFEGDFVNPDANSVMFVSGLFSSKTSMSGLSSMDYSDDRTFALADPSWSVTKIGVMGKNKYTSPAAETWRINSIPGKIHVVFDSNASTLTLSHESAGISSVEADGASLSIVPVAGGVNINASVDSHVDIYSMQGILVRSVDVTAGSTFVDLPSGLYIVNRAKIMVR